MNKKEPLSKGEFQEWRENDFKHLVKKVWRIEGILYVLVPLVLAVLAAVLAVLMRWGRRGRVADKVQEHWPGYIPRRYRDMGDGSYAERQVAAVEDTSGQWINPAREDGNLAYLERLDLIQRQLLEAFGEKLDNPGVEEGSTAPDAWYSAGAASWVDGGYKSAKSLRLNPLAGTAEWRAAYFRVKASTPYKVRGRVKGTAGAQFFLTVRWYTDPGGQTFISENNIALNGSYTDWTLIRDIFDSPGTAQSADMVLRVAAADTGDLLGDDFSVREAS